MISREPDPRYFLWPGYPATQQLQPRAFTRGFEQCPRAGGAYIASDEALDSIHTPIGTPLDEAAKDQLRAKVTTILIDQRRLGVRFPEVSRKLVLEAMAKGSLSVGERANRLLWFLAHKTRSIEQHINLFRDLANGEVPRNDAGVYNRPPFPTNVDLMEAMAWSESTTFEEVIYLARYLQEKELIREQIPQSCIYQLTVDGHSKIAELQYIPRSSQTFVAMWINCETDEAFERGLKPGIKEAGYDVLRIDKKEDVVKIDDEIISEIRRSRLLIADFTQGKDGARGGVYFEAGFALGLGIPIIFSCRRDMVDKLHFDTRQYAHILWGNPDELRVAIRDRIRARVGQGPRANPAIPL